MRDLQNAYNSIWKTVALFVLNREYSKYKDRTENTVI